MTTRYVTDPERFSDDLLIGAAAIAEFLFATMSARRRVYHLAKTSRLPVGRLGSQFVALRSDLIGHMKKQ